MVQPIQFVDPFGSLLAGSRAARQDQLAENQLGVDAARIRLEDEQRRLQRDLERELAQARLDFQREETRAAEMRAEAAAQRRQQDALERIRFKIELEREARPPPFGVQVAPPTGVPPQGPPVINVPPAVRQQSTRADAPNALPPTGVQSTRPAFVPTSPGTQTPQPDPLLAEQGGAGAPGAFSRLSPEAQNLLGIGSAVLDGLEATPFGGVATDAGVAIDAVIGAAPSVLDFGTSLFGLGGAPPAPPASPPSGPVNPVTGVPSVSRNRTDFGTPAPVLDPPTAPTAPSAPRAVVVGSFRTEAQAIANAELFEKAQRVPHAVQRVTTEQGVVYQVVRPVVPGARRGTR